MIQVTIAALALSVALIVLARRYTLQRAAGDAEGMSLTTKRLIGVVGGAVIVFIGVSVLAPNLFG